MMRIIEGKTMICNVCNTTIEYDDKEILPVPGYHNLGVVVCPKCKQQIIMVAEDYKPLQKKQIIVEESVDEQQNT